MIYKAQRPVKKSSITQINQSIYKTYRLELNKKYNMSKLNKYEQIYILRQELEEYKDTLNFNVNIKYANNIINCLTQEIDFLENQKDTNKCNLI